MDNNFNFNGRDITLPANKGYVKVKMTNGNYISCNGKEYDFETGEWKVTIKSIFNYIFG